VFKGSTLNCLIVCNTFSLSGIVCMELINVQSTKMFLDIFYSKRPVFV
jgi:hypothetical protein